MGRKRRKKQHNPSKFYLIILFLLVFFTTIFLLYQLEQKITPPLKEISHTCSTAIANEILDACVAQVLTELPLSANDFITLTHDGSGSSNPSYSANTREINLFCNRLSQAVNTAMQQLPEEKISIPLGALGENPLFANMGPGIPFTLMPAGKAVSDYETSFVSAGINQVNYKIWVNIAMDIQIVNPFFREKVTLTKKIMLVDAIIGGKVPEQFFSMGQNGNIY